MWEECVSSLGLKRHTTLKHVQEEVTPKEQKKVLSAIDEFINIVKKCADSRLFPFLMTMVPREFSWVENYEYIYIYINIYI